MPLQIIPIEILPLEIDFSHQAEEVTIVSEDEAESGLWVYELIAASAVVFALVYLCSIYKKTQQLKCTTKQAVQQQL